MYTFFKTTGASKLAATEAPALFSALILSELLYKFGSFTMECLAFLATWYSISFVLNSFKLPRLNKKSGGRQPR